MLSRTPQKGHRTFVFEHSRPHQVVNVMRIQLVRKLADYLDGIDVSAYRQGDIVELPRRDAELLIAERWAVPFFGNPPRGVRSSAAFNDVGAVDGNQRRTLDQMQHLREAIESSRFQAQQRRRAEDRIREEIQDARARIIRSME